MQLIAGFVRRAMSKILLDSGRRTRTLGTALGLLACIRPGAVQGQSAAVPVPVFSASPSSSPSPSPKPVPGRIGWSLDGSNTFISQHTGGPGIQPPEGPGFSAGSPLSPMTPYDVFSGAPDTPGQAGALQYVSTATIEERAFTASALFGAGLVTGSSTNLAYWGENLLPPYNPHLGSTSLPYRIAFPTAQGQDDGEAQRLSLLGGSVATADGSGVLRAGYFDLTQTERFVFVQPQLTNVTPAIGVAAPESLGDGPPALAWWPPPEAGLPLLGADFTEHRGSDTLELSDALLPALPGTAVRLLNASFAIDGGASAHYAAQVIDVTTGGNSISTTTMFGSGAHVIPGPQGDLPLSLLGNQRETIAGATASFQAIPGIDARIDIARAWYDAQDVMEPGTQKPGGYYRASLSRTLRRAKTSLEFFRFEPRYATEILPYGAPENVWSVAWSWPGVWLKSTYQLVDNSALGANRQGFRFRYHLDPGNGPFQFRASYARYEQIAPATLANVEQTGFVDGFFLPQQNSAGTLGSSQQYAFWASLKRQFATITLDYVNDLQHRPALDGFPQDYVGYVTPQAILTLSKELSGSTLIAVGAGRYAMRGTWATTPLDYGQSLAFVGVQVLESRQAALLVQLRGSHFDGLPAAPVLMQSPDFGDTLLIVQERFRF